jgi:hypothetical protein
MRGAKEPQQDAKPVRVTGGWKRKVSKRISIRPPIPGLTLRLS